MTRIFKLDNRLYSCAQMISLGSSIIDVGSDHAYLPIWLVINGLVSNAIASDINNGPLDKAAYNIKKYKLENKIKLLKCNGLDGVDPNSVDEIVIAGMGGELISEIISQAPWIRNSKKRLILQPMSSEQDLRKYLAERSFLIEKEIISSSKGRVYTTMSIIHTRKKQLLPLEYPYIGKIADNINDNSIEYLKRQIKNIRNKLNSKTKNREDAENEYIIINRIQRLIDDYRRI